MPHLPIPVIRTADAALVAALREVDPTTEFIYLRDGRWALMRLRPLNDTRIKTAHRIMQTTLDQSVKAGGLEERVWYARLRSYRMALMGYSLVSNWSFDGDPDWRVVQDYRERAWKLRHDIPYDDDDAERQRAAEKGRERLWDPAIGREMSKALRNPTSVTQ